MWKLEFRETKRHFNPPNETFSVMGKQVTNGAQKKWISSCRGMKLDFYLSPMQNHKLQMNKKASMCNLKL